MKRQLNFYAHEIYYMNSLILLGKNVLCSQLHCQKVLISFPFHIRSHLDKEVDGLEARELVVVHVDAQREEQPRIPPVHLHPTLLQSTFLDTLGCFLDTLGCFLDTLGCCELVVVHVDAQREEQPRIPPVHLRQRQFLLNL